ncbi:MAG: NfeD family protein [Anaerolineae bacterium]
MGRMMKRWVAVAWLLILVISMVSAVKAQSEGAVVVARVQGVINPLSSRYLDRVLRQAHDQSAGLVVVELDTPGGLESAMREMVQSLLASSVPTVVYVAPRGARATSAGLFVTLAGDVAAMAPATHIGAAHPVGVGNELDDVSEDKAVSDAAAFARSIAATRGRNAEWAERAVRESVSVTEDEVLAQNVVDLVATDLGDLLAQLDGRTVSLPGGEVVLRTREVPVETRSMDLAESLMHAITNPNIAFLLLYLGGLLLLAELADPGLGLAGIAAAVCLILALLALGTLPVNWAGVALLAVALAFFAIGLFTETEIIVSVAGLVPFVLGALLLFAPFGVPSPAAPQVRVSPWLIGVTALTIAFASAVIFRAVVSARRLPPQSGVERLIGRVGVARSSLNPTGQVRVEQEDWSAVSTAGPIAAGQPVRVVGFAGVRLQVEPAADGDTLIEVQGG